MHVNFKSVHSHCFIGSVCLTVYLMHLLLGHITYSVLYIFVQMELPFVRLILGRVNR